MNAKRYVGLFLAVLALVGLMSVIGCETKYTQEEVDTFVQAKEDATLQTTKAMYDANLADYKAEIESTIKTDYVKIIAYNKLLTEKEGLDGTIGTLTSEKEVLQSEIDVYSTEEKITVLEMLQPKYVVDELTLGKIIEPLKLKYSHIETLLDDKIEFDGDKFYIKETFEIVAAKIAINGDDFKEDAYLQLFEDNVIYMLTIDADLDVSKIGTDNYPDELIFPFLGELRKITKWDNTKVTFSAGTKTFFTEGETKTVDGLEVTVVAISNNGVFVQIGDQSEKIAENEIKSFDGVKVKVDMLLNDDDGADFTQLIIGNEIDTIVTNGDYYNDDDASLWTYSISAVPGEKPYIGLVLNTDLTDIDEDEGLNALKYGETLYLPNDYIGIEFTEISEEDEKTYTFKSINLTDEGFGYVIEAKGDFTIENSWKEYTRLYFYGGQAYDKKAFDDRNFTISSELGNEVWFEDNEKLSIVLEISAITISDDKIDYIQIHYMVNEISDVSSGSAISVKSEKDDYMTPYGIVINSPEDNIDDLEVKLTVPEEQRFATLTIIG